MDRSTPASASGRVRWTMSRRRLNIGENDQALRVPRQSLVQRVQSQEDR